MCSLIVLVLLLKHIFSKSLKHIIKAFISTNPTLAVIAKRVLSVPASSSVERLFSVANKIFRPDRLQMKDTTFEHLIIIKCNKDN